MLKFIKLLAVFALIANSTAYAQTKPKLYVNVLLDDDAKYCGITTEDLTASTILFLKNNRIDISSEITLPLLVLAVDTIYDDNTKLCNSIIITEIRTYDKNVNRNGFTPKQTVVLLCHKGYLSIASKSDTPKRVSDATDRLLKLCLSQIDY